MGEWVQPSKEELAQKPVLGEVKYKGRPYYVLMKSKRTSKLWLTVLSCEIDFWALEDQTECIKTYGQGVTIEKLRERIAAGLPDEEQGFDGGDESDSIPF